MVDMIVFVVFVDFVVCFFVEYDEIMVCWFDYEFDVVKFIVYFVMSDGC